MTARHETVTRLLDDVARGESEAASELMPIVYDELHNLAEALFRRERADHTLQPTALVNEVYMRLVDQTGAKWEGRRHFLLVAARAMRNILIDHARGKGRAKRGGGWQQVTLEGIGVVPGQSPGNSSETDFEALDDALTELAALDERKARLVELRFFAGLKSEDAADALGISRTTASEEWRMARAWLHRRLEDSGS